MKHTSLPWKWVDDELVSSNGPILEAKITEYEEAFIDVSDANAKLIAAAPELLEALKDASNAITSSRHDMRYNELVNRIDDAIKKAEG